MPYYRFEIHSAVTAPGMAQRIQRLIVTPGDSWWPRIPGVTAPPFVGTADASHFQLRRDMGNRNSLRPCIKGSIDPIEGGSRISTTITLSPEVIVFTLAWLSIVGVVAIDSLQSRLAPQGMAMAGVFVIGLVSILGDFYFEAFKARRLLERAAAMSDGEATSSA
ncbi:MAG: hypothetical protein ABI411_20855 [Tahibacter sp.]